MGDYTSNVSDAADTASTATDTVSTVADTASTSSGPTLEAAQNIGTNTDGTALMEHGAYEATSPEQGGYFVGTSSEPSMGQTAMGYVDRFQSGAKGTFGDAWNNFREGNYVEGVGYLGNKVGETAMKAGGGGGGGGNQAAPINVQAAQPNPDNSYLRRLQQMRMMQGGYR